MDKTNGRLSLNYGRRWHNVELENGTEADGFRQFLKDNGIRFETSGAYNLVHFEVLVNTEEMESCDTFLGTFIN